MVGSGLSYGAWHLGMGGAGARTQGGLVRTCLVVDGRWRCGCWYVVCL